MLISIQTEMKNLKHQIDYNISVLQSMERGMNDDDDAILVDGPQLPLCTDDDVCAMELALDNTDYQKRLVRYFMCSD